jgi:hypothetical protein
MVADHRWLIEVLEFERVAARHAVRGEHVTPSNVAAPDDRCRGIRAVSLYAKSTNNVKGRNPWQFLQLPDISQSEQTSPQTVPKCLRVQKYHPSNVTCATHRVRAEHDVRTKLYCAAWHRCA